MSRQHYLVALGSNKRHALHGTPAQVLAAALVQFQGRGLDVLAVARTLVSAPVGPSQRRYANTAAVLACDNDPPELLRRLKTIERSFGRKARGQRWGARVLDCDIVLWSGGIWASRGLAIPHPAMRQRRFVMEPATQIAAGWRDPVTGLCLAHLQARLTRPRPLPSAARAPRRIVGP